MLNGTKRKRRNVTYIVFKEAKIGNFLICKKSGFRQCKLSRKHSCFSCINYFVTTSIALCKISKPYRTNCIGSS